MCTIDCTIRMRQLHTCIKQCSPRKQLALTFHNHHLIVINECGQRNDDKQPLPATITTCSSLSLMIFAHHIEEFSFINSRMHRRSSHIAIGVKLSCVFVIVVFAHGDGTHSTPYTTGNHSSVWIPTENATDYY